MKKILIGLSAVVLVIATVPMFAAFEAHVINVTAKIENALYVHPEFQDFGTVFPQEYHELGFAVVCSASFSQNTQQRVKNVEYKIVQKPKPIWPKPTACTATYQTIEEARAYCHDNPGDLNCCYPLLCPYLSKEPDGSPKPGNDEGIVVPHPTVPRCGDGIDNDNDTQIDYPNDPQCSSPQDDSESQSGEQLYIYGTSYGKIDKKLDITDGWIVDLQTPCFEGYCDQEYLEGIKNGTKPPPLPPELESQTFGCDLWVEVTGIY